jgi:hypothetical protein
MSSNASKIVLETTYNLYKVNFFHFFRMGTMSIELYWKHAPKTCQNFYELARKGYFCYFLIFTISDFHQSFWFFKSEVLIF